MKDLRFAKFVVLVNALVPGVLLLWNALHGQVGSDPVNYTLRTTGMLALIFLSLSLLVTPLRQITGLSWLFHFRRLLGLHAFFYALAHFLIFFIFDRVLNVRDTLSEMVKRPYLIIGSLGLLAMVPLAATSTNAMIRRLGPRRWQALHRLAYLAACAGVVHYYMLVKSDIRLPVAFGITLGILLGYRVVRFFWKRQVKSPVAPVATTIGAAADAGRWQGLLRVAEIIQETPDVRTFRLVSLQGGALPFAYRPGQYLTLALPIAGKTVWRSYTIASTPTRPGDCQITIKRDQKGLVSQHMHDTVKVGNILSVAAPAGRFIFTGVESHRLALLAGGVGITPLMAILRYLTDQAWDGQIYLIYCARTERDIIFRSELAALQQRFANIHLTVTLTRAPQTDWAGPTGRMDAALLTRVIPDLTTLPFYICGPAEMLRTTRDLLRQLGVAEPDIKMESFGASPKTSGGAAPAAPGAAAFVVTFAHSQKTAQTAGDRPILELAEEMGITVDSECRSGICGRCKCKMISGSVAMENQDALDPADRQNQMILLCQARALENVTVEA